MENQGIPPTISTVTVPSILSSSPRGEGGHLTLFIYEGGREKGRGLVLERVERKGGGGINRNGKI